MPELKAGQAPHISTSDTLYRETLLYMRIQLKSDTFVLKSCKVLRTLLQNIVSDPNEEKFRRIRLSNDKIKETITNVEQSRFLLELIGFEEVLVPDETGGAEAFLMVDLRRLDTRELVHVIRILDEVISNGGCRVIAEKLGITLPPQQMQQVPPNNKRSA